ncbi:hypothetical protein [Enterococcus faecalis]|uniref:hypothetical protein n=1 Tax=Enterococcus faecalis TaxID=1351 RepID=UPI0035C97AA4
MKSFEKFLNDKNCSIQEIKNYLENIIDTKNNFVCLYSSHMDNLGNSESDIDVYVFSASLVREDYFKVENYIISQVQTPV